MKKLPNVAAWTMATTWLAIWLYFIWFVYEPKNYTWWSNVLLGVLWYYTSILLPQLVHGAVKKLMERKNERAEKED